MIGWGFLLASIALHFLVVEVAPLYRGPDKKNESIEITTVDKMPSQTDRRQKQLVHQDLPKLNDLKPPKARFYSEHDQTVEKEMKASHSGLTRNLMPTLPTPPRSEQENTASSDDHRKQSSTQEDGVTATARRNLNKLKRMRRSLVQFASANDNYLPNIAEGPMTMLSSERFVYYTFFARIQEQVYPRWQSMLKEMVTRMTDAEARRASEHDFVTVLDVIVRPDGVVENVTLTESSGNQTIDHIAQGAFLLTRQFQNPPHGLVREDGRLHLPYAMHFELQRFSQFAWKNQ